jgi:AraC-like DNA-binding protein
MDVSLGSEVSESAVNAQLATRLPLQAELESLQTAYESRTGYQLVVADTNGAIRMGVPNCDRFPCMKSCRECREQIIREAVRTGQVCVDSCHQGYCLWGLPLIFEGRLVGGVVVIGGELAVEKERPQFEAACFELFSLMKERNLLPPEIVGNASDAADVHRFIHRKAFARLEAQTEEIGREMIHAMKTAQFSEARSVYQRLRAVLLEGSMLPIEVWRGVLVQLIFRARNQFVDIGMDDYACYAEAGMLVQAMSLTQDTASIAEVMDNFLDRFELILRQRHKHPDDLLIERATTYLEEHLREELDRETVAKAVGISPSHLSRLLREKKGRTFTDLLNQYRIERASSLLIRTSHTLAEIAGESGFCDQSYFSKVFRRYKSQTPARYRETHSL